MTTNLAQSVTQVTGLCGFSLTTNIYDYSLSGLLGGPRFINEFYSIASIDNSSTPQFLGNCAWEGSFPDVGSIGVTATPIFEFGVSSATGIYKDVVKVVIDFSNQVRVLAFISSKSGGRFGP
jgi:hypothetical protein